AAWADEGMWTFHDFPAAAVKQKYGVDVTPQWLDRVRTATVRLSGCTASFVSPDGLLLTNFHCVETCLAEHSSRESSLHEKGFLAGGRDKEVRCGTQVADVLMAVEDITPKIAAATRGQDDKAANEARKKTLTTLEAACEAASRKDRSTGPLKCESVNLYDGGQYFLYKYQRYDDVRLVFAPEAGIAMFGGDPDNFQYPRWCLDMSLLRAYQNGKPAATPNHLRIDFAGPDAGEPVFVSGHPGGTDRLLAVSELETLRDVDLPTWLLRNAELRGRYIQFGKTSEASGRIVNELIGNFENGIKVRRKLLDALHDDAMLERKQQDQAVLQARIAADPKLAASVGNPWAEIDKAQATERALALPYTFLESGAGFNSRLFRYARSLVRGAAERDKTNTDRLREYTESALPRIEQQLAAATPVYPELEQLTLSFSLERMREWLGPDHPVIRRLLAKESPDMLAKRVVEGSKLADPATRLSLWKGGSKAVAASDDPMIELARLVDPDARTVRKRYEDEVEAPVDAASERIAQARFAALGTSVYPDATFTLRLNYGTVQGWVENGEQVQPFTTLARAFERATGEEPFAIPERWQKAKPSLDMSTRFNLSTNNDIVGGNSGSPLIDADGAIVGLLFDGNIHSISGSYWFDKEKNRAVAVHPAIIREALSKVYGAGALLAELSQR
ncbi:MAG TPA: S46 family peptidase, partial [Steroidobacteraceae bacterium]|nr:S46 family peptidase [Steroidobacteraceae bacterium]